MAKKASKKAPKNITIELKPSIGADPEQPDASRRSADRVRWSNTTDRGHTIIFTVWPFVEPPQPIQVEAGGKSDWFTVYKDASLGLYDYTIEPSINPPSGPPGDPGVLVGD